MDPTAALCAREIFDVTPTIIQAIRFELRSLRLSDLSVPQFRTLAYIDRHPGGSLSEVADFIGLTPSSMSILINGLVGRGMVSREQAADDRRRVTLRITATGAELLAYARQGAQARLADMFAPLSADERMTIIRAMELMRPIFQPSVGATDDRMSEQFR